MSIGVIAAARRRSSSTAVGAAFDAATKSATVALSNSDYTATKSGASLGGAKSLYAKKTGKHYFEAVLTTRVSTGVGTEAVGGCGLARIDASYPTPSVQGYGVFVFQNTGSFWVDRALGASFSTPASGDRYCFAVDLTNGLVWCRKGSGNWNGSGTADPATGVGGISLGDLAGYALTPFATFYNANECWTLATSAADLVQSVPSGFNSGWSASSAQDNSGLGNTTLQSVKNVNISLSNGNLTATRSATGAVARSRDSKSEGKQYIEFTIGQISGGNDGCGVADLDATYSEIGDGGTKCAFVYKSGNIWTGGANMGSIGSALSAGNVISLAIDWTNLRFWFRKNGGNWNNSGTANPATNTGGFAFVFTTPPGYAGRIMAPAVTFGSSGSASGDNITMNAGSSAFSYSVPSGFESGWDVEGNP